MERRQASGIELLPARRTSRSQPALYPCPSLSAPVPVSASSLAHPAWSLTMPFYGRLDDLCKIVHANQMGKYVYLYSYPVLCTITNQNFSQELTPHHVIRRPYLRIICIRAWLVSTPCTKRTCHYRHSSHSATEQGHILTNLKRKYILTLKTNKTNKTSTYDRLNMSIIISIASGMLCFSSLV